MLRHKLIVRVIRIPPHHPTYGITHRETSGGKVGAGETDHTLERYRPGRAVALINRDVKIKSASRISQAPRLAFNDPIPGVRFEDNGTAGSSGDHLRPS